MSTSIFSKDHRLLIEKLKGARKEAGLEQKEVADAIGKSQSYFPKVESGQRRLDIIQLKEFAKVKPCKSLAFTYYLFEFNP